MMDTSREPDPFSLARLSHTATFWNGRDTDEPHTLPTMQIPHALPACRTFQSQKERLMKQIAHALVFGSLAAQFSLSALADHNSPMGAGWANMPNYIHNTQIEDDLIGAEFSDFVRQVAGADTVNRYLDTSTLQSGAGSSAIASGGGRR